MKKIALLTLAALVLAISIPASAQQFADVPTDHWAYAAVQQLAQAGIIQGYPDGTF
ncbi:MAG TPA: S-layer homology domain-containing protein, partial [Armatimonadetes bacterium]|nr:S-layer homology domain-containing protein [Armatimonadota bacterium]